MMKPFFHAEEDVRHVLFAVSDNIQEESQNVMEIIKEKVENDFLAKEQILFTLSSYSWHIN